MLSLTPTEVLKFSIQKGVESKEVLKITNISQNKIIFKVKTTQPTWYYVRPNQQALDVGATENVVIVLVEAEGLRYLDLSESDRKEKFDKHRFLVQSKIISDADFSTLKAASSAERSEEFTKIWNSDVDDKKNMKLKVEFVTVNEPVPSSAALYSIRDSSESLRQKLLKHNEATGNGDENAELRTLRKKYDAVVEYTVHLTAERDSVVSQLEEMQKELAREKARKKMEVNRASMINDKYVSTARQGLLSFTLLVIVAILSFLLAKYFKL